VVARKLSADRKLEYYLGSALEEYSVFTY
jgi:hypothetical protein